MLTLKSRITEGPVCRGRLKTNVMKQLKKIIEYAELSESELSAEDLMLVNNAKCATSASYSPFSHFSVGAAVLLANGEVVKGCNQENDAFPSGLCAERTAIFSAGAQFPDIPITAIAIAAFSDGDFLDDPITPCGACAQVMFQVERKFADSNLKLKIILYGKKRTFILNSVESLLPFSFKLDSDIKK